MFDERPPRVWIATRKWSGTLPPIPRRNSGIRRLDLFHVPRPAESPGFDSVRPVGCCSDTTSARSFDCC